MASHTSVLALNFGHFGLLAADSRTSLPNASVQSDQFDKMVKLYPGVWGAASGSMTPFAHIKGMLPGHMAQNLPDPGSMLDIATEVAAVMNAELPQSENSYLRFRLTLIGSVPSSEEGCKVFNIVQDQNHRYYPELGADYTTNGSGEFMLELYRVLHGFNLGMSFLEAAKYAARAICAATQMDWRSGGIIRVIILLPNQMDVGITWTQGDILSFNNCEQRYFIREGPVLV